MAYSKKEIDTKPKKACECISQSSLYNYINNGNLCRCGGVIVYKK